jgi:hypothetical protein
MDRLCAGRIIIQRYHTAAGAPVVCSNLAAKVLLGPVRREGGYELIPLNRFDAFVTLRQLFTAPKYSGLDMSSLPCIQGILRGAFFVESRICLSEVGFLLGECKILQVPDLHQR